MTRCARHLGDSFTLTFAPSGIRFVMISDPDAVKELFTAPAELAPSGAGNSPVAGVMGPHSVVVLTGPEHMRQRKLLLPPFHGERMREYEQVIAAATRSEMARWRLGAPVSTLQPMRRITLEVILRAVFGVEAERMSELRSAIGDLLSPSRTLGLLRAALRPPAPGRPPGDVGRALDRLDDLIYAELTRRRAAGDLGERKDILSLLMQARDERDEPMSDAELRDELVTLLLAGHETTATSVAWALERLVRRPASLGRLIAEVDAGEGDRYMNAVINETLRVRPVVPLVVRVLTGPMRVGDRVLPQGTRVVPSIYLTNRNPRVYEHPGEFRPERFLEGAPDTFAWIPFGGGIRRCIGASFAQFEMKVILSTILAGLLPRRPSGLRGRRGELTTRRVITLVPASGARVIWERRRG
jgi:cytochrome P450